MPRAPGQARNRADAISHRNKNSYAWPSARPKLRQYACIAAPTTSPHRLRRNGRTRMISLTINGQSHNVDVEPDTPLLWVLRDTIGLTGTKFGCGIAQCGACTVHVDGAAVRSCSMPVSAVAGKQVATIESI